ncbi:NACHT domain-containing protein [Lyngbya sp. CCY1209]|uniref:NACHT domain-containing protein n=1 Tax=Lyngbya sp. CCY1209 TaxID=2886103 RepID=UPI002D204F43|nr:NACHT domain-containing protein [Lyngbya sp. CCY1209]MEB3882660.1 NACHT domain-containing protein [Lyngbya sp. CCY1209]
MSRLSATRLSSQKRHQLLLQVKREVRQYRLHLPHRAVLTQLAGEKPPLKMRRSWDVEVKIGNHPSFKLSANTGIIEVFDRIGGRLLILGGAGSGKTTTLVGLAKVLVDRALKDEHEPMPVWLNLSGWRVGCEAIEDWIVGQIQKKYAIAPDVARYWMEQLQILPLLDGLDEVEPGRREASIREINDLLEGNLSPLHLVVCSGVKAYHRCENRFRLNGAILLRPLTRRQVKTYLIDARSRELWNDIKNDPQLLKLAKKPLFLSLMTLAYENILISSWKHLDTLDEQRQYLLNAYLRHQISATRDRGLSEAEKKYTSEQFRHWLTELAKRMQREETQTFILDRIPKTWLHTPEQERAYRLAERAVGGVIWWGVVAVIALGAISGSVGLLATGMVLGLAVAAGYEWLSLGWAIERLALRFVLWGEGDAPWNYAQFLNDAARRLLLRKMGDRYEFIHRLLQEHLAQI